MRRVFSEEPMREPRQFQNETPRRGAETACKIVTPARCSEFPRRRVNSRILKGDVMPITRRTLLTQIGIAAAFGASASHSGSQDVPLRFCIMGDRTGGAQKGVYERTLDLIVSEQPAFVINVGDSIEGLQDFWTDIEWLDMKKLWRRYGGIPHYCTPGNHDIWSLNAQRLYTQFTGHAPQYSFTHGPCHITVLDNSRSEMLAEDQVEFLRKDLAAHRDSPLKLVFVHKPFWVPFLMLKSGEFDLHRACREHGVQWVFSGHLHHLWHLRRDGVQYVSMGSSGGSIDRGKRLGQGFSHGWFYHYGVAEVSGAKLVLRIKELPSPFGEGREFPIDEWWENRPASQLRRAAAKVLNAPQRAISAAPPTLLPAA